MDLKGLLPTSIASAITTYTSERLLEEMQRGDTPIYPVLRSSSSVKVLTCLTFALTLDQEYNFALTFD